MRKVESRGRGKRLFRKTAIRTNVKNIPMKAVPRGGIRL
jgi:hypothetical protein